MLWLNTSGGVASRISRASSRQGRKSGVRISTLVSGLRARTSRMHSAKWAAPPSGRSSRSTEVITTYLSPRSATDSARCLGSSGSSPLGRPKPTSQNEQRRVQMSPMIMKVAVPPPKHSGRLGQAASSHTVCSFCLRSIDLMRWISPLAGTRTRIQSGLRSRAGRTSLTSGMVRTLSAPRSLSPTLTFAFTGRWAWASLMGTSLEVICLVGSAMECTSPAAGLSGG